MVDRGFLPTRSGEEKLRGQYRGCNPSFLPHKGNQVGGQALGAERVLVSLLSEHWEGPGRAGLQDRQTTCCKDAQLSPKFPLLISEKPENSIINACAIGKILHRVHSACTILTAVKTKTMPLTGKGRKILSQYLSIHTHIFLLIINPSKLQISPEMQKYGLYSNEKTHTCFKCHANSIVVAEVMQCQLQLPCSGEARWKCLRRECDL